MLFVEFEEVWVLQVGVELNLVDGWGYGCRFEDRGQVFDEVV